MGLSQLVGTMHCNMHVPGFEPRTIHLFTEFLKKSGKSPLELEGLFLYMNENLFNLSY